MMTKLTSLSSITLAATLVATALAATAFTSTATAATCYRLPFSNPNLRDGFGSTKGRAHPHRGVDFPQPRGKSIPAAATGTVSVVTKSTCLGNVIVLKHADGKYSGYAHMQARSPLTVGRKVTRGQAVGKVGATGTCAFGAHLHMTMSPSRTGYAAGTVIDPYRWIQNHKCSTARVSDPADAEPLTDETLDETDLEAFASMSDDELAAMAAMEDAELATIVAAAEEVDATGLETDDVDEDVEPMDETTEAPAEDTTEAGGCATSNGGALGASVVVLLGLAFARRRRSR